MILDGRKTQTRRLWPKSRHSRVKVGAVHQCYTRPAWMKVDPGTPFAQVKILDVRRQALGAITSEDARCEGYDGRTDYLVAFAKINHWPVASLACPDCASRNDLLERLVWVVDFRLVSAPATPVCST